MGQAIPRQHPAVVLRSHFNQLRALLAAALVAVVALTVAVVILATNDETDSSGGSASATSALTPQQRGSAYADAISALTPQQLGAAFGDGSIAPGTRYDGGPEEGTRGALTRPGSNVAGNPGARYDGGPEEGSADVTPAHPRVTQQQAFPGLASQAEAAGGQSDSASSQSGTKDYSLNGATGDVSAEPQAQTGSRGDGADEGSQP
jgi:hypothetical protein